MRTSLIIVAALGWLTSVGGAVLGHQKGLGVGTDTDGVFYAKGSDRGAWWALLLVVVGASLGALGTIVAVVVTE